MRRACLAMVAVALVAGLAGGCGDGSKKAQAVTSLGLTPIAEFGDNQPTGVALSKDSRIFVCFPKWSENHDLSVVEVLSTGVKRPYPNDQWNRWQPGADGADRFVCVQSVYIDQYEGGTLWILDAASPKMEGVVKGGPKLVKVDLSADRVVDVFRFDESIAPTKSYLNDVRIDMNRGYAYITDSGLGAIVVLNLKSRQARRVLEGHPSTQAQRDLVVVVNGQELRHASGEPPQIHADGIALTKDGEYLYYQVLTGKKLSMIPTAVLRDANSTPQQISDAVQPQGQTVVCDGMLCDAQGDLYLTAIEQNAIVRRKPDCSMMTVIQDSRLLWPDSLAVSCDGHLYVTASQIHLMPKFNMGVSRRTTPYMMFRVDNYAVPMDGDGGQPTTTTQEAR